METDRVEYPSLLRAAHWYRPASPGTSGLMVNVERLTAPSVLLLIVILLPVEVRGVEGRLGGRGREVRGEGREVKGKGKRGKGEGGKDMTATETYSCNKLEYPVPHMTWTRHMYSVYALSSKCT